MPNIIIGQSQGQGQTHHKTSHVTRSHSGHKVTHMSQGHIHVTRSHTCHKVTHMSHESAAANAKDDASAADIVRGVD